MEQKPTLKYKNLAMNTQRDLLATWYGKLATAEETKLPIAYMLVPGSVSELVRLMGFEIVFPEINALQCGMKKTAGKMILKAEDLGYSSDVCGYVKNEVGLFLTDRESPTGKLPAPDLLVCNYVGCTTFVKWFEALASYYEVPLFMLDAPYIRGDGITLHQRDYFVQQLRDLADLCGSISGAKYDEDKLKEMLRYSKEAEDLWVKILHSAKHVPTPIDSYFEAVFFMSPVFLMRGMPETVEFYKNAWLEVEERMQLGIGPLPEEKVRAVIEGPPAWPHFRAFWDLFKKWGVVSVASTYSKVGGLFDLGFRHDPDHPLESIAEYCMGCYTNISLPKRAKLLKQYLEEYSADCLVIHSVKSCRSFSMGQADMREYFMHEVNVPTLQIESDLADPRYFQRAQLMNRIDAFFESLEHRRLTAV
ncbi:MAG: 2-hydroxyacyl-CoA dehydratase [Candidatus Tectomicrobia bacterium]|nr:2-hydroxyacyl-CoA dehydratase [Candidatus Tectomicrobia bacterium]